MEDYNKIIESLNVHFKQVNDIKVTQPITIGNYYDVENSVFRLNSGELRFGAENTLLDPGEFYPTKYPTRQSSGQSL